MADTPQTFLVAEDLRPAYYDDFHCLAAGCRQSCCKEWRVSFDKKDYLALKRQTGSPELNKRMDHGLRRIRDKDNGLPADHYAEFVLQDGVCPLLREDCLCHLQVEKGPEALPMVCRTFPRSEHYSVSGYLERSLSPGCEGVLALLWDLPEGVEFRADPLPKEKIKARVLRDPSPILENFQAIRSTCIDLLQDRRRPLPERILLIGIALKELADGAEDVPSWPARTAALSEQLDTAPLLPDSDKALALFLSDHMRTLVSTQRPAASLEEVRRSLLAGMGISVQPEENQATVPLGPYLEARKRYEERFGDRDYFMENLMVTLFFHLCLPNVQSQEELWKSYVNFCNLYSFFRFSAVMSCREGAPGDREELFRLLVHASRMLLHNGTHQARLRDELFQHDSATLAHMAILLGG